MSENVIICLKYIHISWGTIIHYVEKIPVIYLKWCDDFQPAGTSVISY